jgi:hypothetical protein
LGQWFGDAATARGAAARAIALRATHESARVPMNIQLASKIADVADVAGETGAEDPARRRRWRARAVGVGGTEELAQPRR